MEAVQLIEGAGFCWRGNERYHTASYAAARGDVDLVRHVLPPGATRSPPPLWGREVLHTAAGAGCEPLLEYVVAVQGGKDVEVSGRAPYLTVAKHGDRATLDALRRLGLPWGVGDNLESAVGGGCAESVLRWLVEQGAPVGSRERMGRALVEAVKRGMLGAEVAEWLRAICTCTRPPRFTP